MAFGKESNGEQPLLGKKAQVQAVPVAIAGLDDSSTRNWQGKLYACFGDCDNTGDLAARYIHQGSMFYYKAALVQPCFLQLRASAIFCHCWQTCFWLIVSCF